MLFSSSGASLRGTTPRNVAMRTLIPTLLLVVAGGLAAAETPAPSPLPAPAGGAEAKPAAKPALTLADLPEAVRTAVQKQLDGAEVERLKAEEKKGETSYTARWTKDGVRNEARFAADGRVLKLKAERKGKDGEVSIAALPEAVRKAIEARSAGGKVAEVEQEEEKGKMVYAVEIQRAADRLELELSAEGTILEEKVKGAEEKKGGEEKKGKEGKEKAHVPVPMPAPAPAPAAP